LGKSETRESGLASKRSSDESRVLKNKLNDSGETCIPGGRAAGVKA
jgi:hypothetical protein